MTDIAKGLSTHLANLGRFARGIAAVGDLAKPRGGSKAHFVLIF
jgi:hypothetical protein